MLGKYNRYGVLKIFLDGPLEEFGLRELSRKSKLAPVSVARYLREFIEEGIIKKSSKKERPVYQAIRENENFILYKKMSILYELQSCGLIDYLWQNLGPDTLVLYGSYAKGEAIGGSDVDIFVVGEDKKINLDRFERSLGKSLHLIFEKDVDKISKELKNNLINGVVLKGYLKLFK